MRSIGIDLAITGAHKAVVLDERGRAVTPVLTVRTRAEEFDALCVRAREGAPADEPLVLVLEPTGWAWLPIAVYAQRQGIRVYLVNSRQVADLRRFYKRHAKSDRIDARVLARLPLMEDDAGHLHALELPPALTLACQRACKELDRLLRQSTALKNRLRAIDRSAWPGLEETLFPEPYTSAARWVREHYYNPVRVLAAGAPTIRRAWQATAGNAEKSGDAGEWAEGLVVLAQQVVALYGDAGRFLDFDLLQGEVTRLQAHLAFLEDQQHTVRLELVHRLYRQIHPTRHLETIPGVGQEGAAVYASFIGNPQRFASVRAVRGWSGLVPNSKQSAGSEAKGLHITQAGPNLIRKFAYLDAETARRFDPQLAALYYEQMMHRGKHHNQAICACATHLLDRVLCVLQEERPYELRDVDGRPVTPAEAQAIIAERYTVPASVRQRNNKRMRQERRDRQAEKRTARESRSRR